MGSCVDAKSAIRQSSEDQTGQLSNDDCKTSCNKRIRAFMAPTCIMRTLYGQYENGKNSAEAQVINMLAHNSL